MNLECVVNLSEGRDADLIGRLASVCGRSLLDVHSDGDHHRSVFTLAGEGGEVEEAARAMTSLAVAELDITKHAGQHPRLGVVDVVPFVPLRSVARISNAHGNGSEEVSQSGARLIPAPPLEDAVGARDRFAAWMSEDLGVPCFLYGPLRHGHRALPEIRRGAFADVMPENGATSPHATAGACAVGARHFLVAYNVVVGGGDINLARSIAAAIRGPAVRSLAFEVTGEFQVSCNLVDPLTIGPAEVRDAIAEALLPAGGWVERCELVGLLPAAVLARIPRDRWKELAVSPAVTIEERLDAAGISWR